MNGLMLKSPTIWAISRRACTARLTLNPISHIDPIGLIMLFFAQIGWAKPVPINPNNFSNYRQGEMQVSLAGPLANLITALVATIFFALTFKYNMVHALAHGRTAALSSSTM